MDAQMSKSLTTGPVARAAGVSEQLIRAYADEGLLPCVRTPAGVRLFGREAPTLARTIYETRMRRRGRGRD